MARLNFRRHIHLDIKGKKVARRAEPHPMEGHGLARRGGHGHANEAFAIHNAVGGIKIEPSLARQKHLRPGMGVAAAGAPRRRAQIAGDEPGRDAEAPGRVDHQNREVAATAEAAIQSLAGRPRLVMEAPLIGEVFVDRMGHGDQGFPHAPRAIGRRETPGEAGHLARAVIVGRRQGGREVALVLKIIEKRRAGGGKGLIGRRDPAPGRMLQTHVAHEAQFIGPMRETRPGDRVAEHIPRLRDRDRAGGNIKARGDHALIAILARAKHHAVLAEAHRPAISVTRQMSDGKDRHRIERLTAISPDSSMRLLGPGDPAPVSVQNPGAVGPFLLVCDHAGRATPLSLGRLGLAEAAFEQHIAWDIGALDLARRLAVILDATLIHQAYSRLVIDCNRAPDHPGAILAVSDGWVIPGNEALSPAEVAGRVEAIHAPYHGAIAAELDTRAGARRETLLVCVHSFTPKMAGHARPWHVGILHGPESPACEALLDLLRRENGLVVGDNEPYAMDGTDYTAPLHAWARGADVVEIEVRQDLIADDAGVDLMAELFGRLLPLIFPEPAP